jgi:hypothetical protein
MNNPGVFAVIVAKDEKGILIDIGEASDVRVQVENHRSQGRWNKLASAGTLCFAALYTPGLDQADRSSIEQGIRSQYDNSGSGKKPDEAG